MDGQTDGKEGEREKKEGTRGEEGGEGGSDRKKEGNLKQQALNYIIARGRKYS